MITKGSIKAATIGNHMVVSEVSVLNYHKMQQPITQATGTHKEDLPEYKKYAQLGDNVISLRAAAEKYNIPPTTISGWIARQLISVTSNDGRRKLLPEQDIAFFSEIYHANKGRGKWLFNADGTPYVPRSEKTLVAA